jgi:hypothetical protein
MIRAMSKGDNDFIYIYSIYEGSDKTDIYYLASRANHQGLIVYNTPRKLDQKIVANKIE